MNEFTVCFAIKGDAYEVTPVESDRSVALKAFRFRKLGGDKAVYNLRLTRHGIECECLGYLRHGRCKHVNTLAQASTMLELSPREG